MTTTEPHRTTDPHPPTDAAPADVAPTGAAPTGVSATGAAPTGVSATLRFFAAARTAVGRDDQRVEVPAGERPTVGRLLTEVRPVEGTSAADFRDVLLRCSFLVDGLTTRDREQLVPDGAVIDVMPPFAGG